MSKPGIERGECRSRYVMLIRLPSRETGDVVNPVARRIKRLPESLEAVADVVSRQRAGTAQVVNGSDPMRRATSAIHQIPGSGVRMRIPTNG
jgi:hypothetical protein